MQQRMKSWRRPWERWVKLGNEFQRLFFIECWVLLGGWAGTANPLLNNQAKRLRRNLHLLRNNSESNERGGVGRKFIYFSHSSHLARFTRLCTSKYSHTRSKLLCPYLERQVALLVVVEWTFEFSKEFGRVLEEWKKLTQEQPDGKTEVVLVEKARVRIVSTSLLEAYSSDDTNDPPPHSTSATSKDTLFLLHNNQNPYTVLFQEAFHYALVNQPRGRHTSGSCYKYFNERKTLQSDTQVGHGLLNLFGRSLFLKGVGMCARKSGVLGMKGHILRYIPPPHPPLLYINLWLSISNLVLQPFFL